MHPRSQPWQSYRQVALQTASPGQLILMLYEGVIGFLGRALAGFQCDEPNEFHQTVNNNLLRAQAILQELNGILNLEAGGEFADRMRGLYLYLDRRLQESNLRKEPTGIQEVLSRVTVLRDAWAEMLRRNGASADASRSPRVVTSGRPELVLA